MTALLRVKREFPAFYDKIDFDGPVMPRMETKCWLWTGCLNPSGYGTFSFGRRLHRAHRFIFIKVVRAVSQEYEVHHRCRNKACVNWNHLEAKKHPEHAKTHRRTHCRRGHALTLANTYMNVERGGKTRRRCRLCERQRWQDITKQRKEKQ